MIHGFAPGVYAQRLDAGAPKIAAVRTDVAAFVGIAVRGPIDRPVPVESWRQFQAHFGDFFGSGYLAYAVHAFFANGGRRCWAVRVADRSRALSASHAWATADPAQPLGWTVSASTPGAWGNGLSVQLSEVRVSQAVLDGHQPGQDATPASQTSGFERRSLVRLRQPGQPDRWRVLSAVDHVGGRLVWRHADRPRRLATDGVLGAVDPNGPLYAEAIEYALVVRAEGRVVETHRRLSAVTGHERYAPQVLADAYPTEKLGDVPSRVIVRDHRDEAQTPAPLASDGAPHALTGGWDGLSSMTAGDFIGEPADARDSDETKRIKRRGLEAVRDIEEISILAVPDIHIRPEPTPRRRPPEPCRPDPCALGGVHPTPQPPAAVFDRPPVFDLESVYRVQESMLRQCEAQQDRVAVLETPGELALDDSAGLSGVMRWRGRFESKYAALYHPWVKVASALSGGGASLVRDLPPCGHVAGRYAGTDFEIGVHKAPANTALSWVQDVSAAIDQEHAGVLNPMGINAIRAFPGRGLRIYGARTVSSDPDWRYVNVRRLILMIRKAVELATQWAVFEPNDVFTRSKIHLALTGFLSVLWQKGALVGDAPEQAFFVKCDEENNPPQERDHGRLIADVGIAPSVPFEFVVLRIGQTDGAFDVSETAQQGVV